MHNFDKMLLSSYLGSNSAVEETLYEAVVCGGVDKILRIYGSPKDLSEELSKPQLLSSYELSAPILCIDCIGSYVACSLMDGSHAVVSKKYHEYFHYCVCHD
jgi:hypothetical protein